MKITVNSKEIDTQSKNLAELTKELKMPETGVAIAIDNRMIQRSNWEETQLVENMDIMIIVAACGG